jgi:heme/copper-type cytochrome/quinol oxidase subunit 2
MMAHIIRLSTVQWKCLARPITVTDMDADAEHAERSKARMWLTVAPVVVVVITFVVTSYFVTKQASRAPPESFALCQKIVLYR